MTSDQYASQWFRTEGDWAQPRVNPDGYCGEFAAKGRT